ncbi:MAG: hypothetical protein AAF437_16245 [Pseudomonadota bacterium]
MKMLGKTAIVAIGFGILVSPVCAQELRSASENVVACQDVVDALERLDCFEKAAAELSLALAAPVPTQAAAPVAANPSTPAAPIEQAVVATNPAAAASATQAPAVQQAAATTTEENIPQSRLPSWIPRVTFGSGRDVEKEPDEYDTTITRIQVNRLGRHFFTTSEGHVWKQKKIEKIRAPKNLPAEAILYQNITGGILIKIKETNRSYRVDRVE